MRFLFIILFLFFGCDSNPSGPSLDLCGVPGGNDINEDGYHCGDLQVLNDIIYDNSLNETNPLDIGYGNTPQIWENNILVYLKLPYML